MIFSRPQFPDEDLLHPFGLSFFLASILQWNSTAGHFSQSKFKDEDQQHSFLVLFCSRVDTPMKSEKTVILADLNFQTRMSSIRLVFIRHEIYGDRGETKPILDLRTPGTRKPHWRTRSTRKLLTRVREFTYTRLTRSFLRVNVLRAKCLRVKCSRAKCLRVTFSTQFLRASFSF